MIIKNTIYGIFNTDLHFEFQYKLNSFTFIEF